MKLANGLYSSFILHLSSFEKRLRDGSLSSTDNHRLYGWQHLRARRAGLDADLQIVGREQTRLSFREVIARDGIEL